ncbi:MAG: MFS transporter [Roseiflexaceae bacterium]|nr:MFS transporter [Roseiflexaceae bacterium]
MDRQTTQRNMRFLVLEIFWAAIAVGCYSFAAAYLIRLGGTNLQVSLLTSAAALVNALTSIPFAIFLERRANRWPWIVGSLWTLRAGHMGLILVPFLPAYRPEAIVALLLFVNVPVALFNAGWLPMFADVVPLARRAQLFSARNMTLNVTLMITTFVMGRWLDAAPFPYNYQLMFGLAVVTSFLSTVYVARIVAPQSAVVVPTKQATARLTWVQIREQIVKQRSFVNITLNTLIFNIAFWMGTPLQPIYFVRELNATDGWLGLWIGLTSGGAILGNLIWPRLINRRGYNWVLVRATVLSASYYFLIGLFPNLTLILLFAFLFGAISPGVDISHFNTLLEVCEPQRRGFYIGVFVTVMNLGFFFSALLAAPLLDRMDARILVFILGGLRLLGAVLFTVNPVHARSLEAVAS